MCVFFSYIIDYVWFFFFLYYDLYLRQKFHGEWREWKSWDLNLEVDIQWD